MIEIHNTMNDNLPPFREKALLHAFAATVKFTHKRADRLLKVNKHKLLDMLTTMSPYEIMVAVERPFVRVVDSENLSRDEKLQLMSVDASTDWLSFFDGMDSIHKIRKQEVDRVREVWEIVSPELKNIDFPEKRDPMLDLDFLESDN